MRLASVPGPIVYAAGLAVGKGMSFALLPLVTHAIPAAEYGTLELLTTIADIATIIVGFGLADALYRFAGGPIRGTQHLQASSAILGAALALASLAAIGLQLAAPLIARAMPVPTDVLVIRIMLFSIALEACIQVPLSWLRMRDAPLTYFWFTCGRAVVQAALVLAFVSWGLGLLGIVVAGAVASLGMAVGLCAVQWRVTGLTMWGPMSKPVLRYGAPLVLAGAASFVLGSLDRLFLAPAVSVETIAQYGLAVKFASIVAFAFQPFACWWFPIRIGILDQPGGAHSSARLVGLGAGILILAGLALIVAAPLALVKMTPAAYHGAIAFVPWLVLIVVIQHLGDLCNVGCFVGTRTTAPALINLACAGLALVGYLVLIPSFGVWGAILSTAMAQSARLVAFFVTSQNTVSLPYPVSRVILLGGVALAVVASLSFVSESNVVRQLVGAGGLVVAILVAVHTRLVWIKVRRPYPAVD